MLRQDLCGCVWSLRLDGDQAEAPAPLRGRDVPATVPGCVHTALMAAGLLDDPYVGLNEESSHWIGRSDWRYACTFDADAALLGHARIELVFEGLDTVAVVTLNGVEVGRGENMHQTHRFDVRTALRRRGNELVVQLRSPVQYARAMERRLGELPYLNCSQPFNMIRKMACNFGWDWGPVLTTSGIWKPVRLEAWDTARLASVRPETLQLTGDRARVRVAVRAEVDADPTGATLRVELPDVSGVAPASIALRPGEAGHSVTFDLAGIEPWWPIGHGGQRRYTCVASIVDAAGRELDRRELQWGIRTVELDTSPDDVGARFVLKVNGLPIFCKGFNWIPDDCFLDRACQPRRYRERIEQTVAANANMLRVWGGGIFETDAFYDLCDELGVMVWQDMLFACAAYAEEEPMRSLVEAEVRDNVQRLAHHPSLVLWNGCNENLWGYHDWGWKRDGLVAGRTWGPGYYLRIVPALLRELDPLRPYWAASPWSGDPDWDEGLHPNLATHGNKHVWEAWFGDHYEAYRRFSPRFCSEFGFQAPATYASIAAAVPRDALSFAHEQMRHRQKSCGLHDDGDQRNFRHLLRGFKIEGLQQLIDDLRHPEAGSTRKFFGNYRLHAPGATTTRFDDLHYLLQLNQARALTLGVEWFRSRQPLCMGTLYWQLNDCWPGATSWSALSYGGLPKPLWYATRRFYAPRLLTIQPDVNARPQVIAINDTDASWTGSLTLRRMRFDGSVLAQESVEVAVAPASTARPIESGRTRWTPRDPGEELLVAELDGHRATWFFRADRGLAYPRPAFDATLQRHGSGQRLTIAARSLLRDLCVFVDRLDPTARISDQMVTLLPGDRVSFDITAASPLDQADLTAPPVLRCANVFGRVAG